MSFFRSKYFSAKYWAARFFGGISVPPVPPIPPVIIIDGGELGEHEFPRRKPKAESNLRERIRTVLQQLAQEQQKVESNRLARLTQDDEDLLAILMHNA